MIRPGIAVAPPHPAHHVSAHRDPALIGAYVKAGSSATSPRSRVILRIRRYHDRGISSSGSAPHRAMSSPSSQMRVSVMTTISHWGCGVIHIRLQTNDPSRNSGGAASPGTSCLRAPRSCSHRRLRPPLSKTFSGGSAQRAFASSRSNFQSGSWPGHAASAGRTRCSISAPRSRSTTARSVLALQVRQNCGRLPK
jgi:hypothetical protein